MLPSLSPFVTWTLGFSITGSAENIIHSFASHALRRHLERLMLQLAAPDYGSARFQSILKRTSLGFLFPSAFAVETALFFVS